MQEEKMVPEKGDPEVGESADNLLVDLDRHNISVVPGESASITITISNHSLIENRYNIAVKGIPQSWIVNSLEQIRISPGAKEALILRIKPPHAPDSKAGRCRVNVEVSDERDAGQSKNVLLTLTVQAFIEYQSEVQPQQLTANQDFNVIINNLGNTREIFEVVLVDQEKKFTFNPPIVKVVVPTGETESTRIKATLRLPHLFWGERKYTVTARVNSRGDTNQEHSLEILSQPAFSAWILLVPLLVCVVFGCYGTMILTSNAVANVFEEIALDMESWFGPEMSGARITPSTPFPTHIPTSTLKSSHTIDPSSPTNPTPTVSPTPIPDGFVIVDEIYVWTGPGEEFSQVHTLLSGVTLKVIGQYDDCSWLKISAGEGVEGWIFGAASEVQLNLDCANIPHGTFRPKNGTLIFSEINLDGPGELTVENGTSLDGLIILVDSSAQPLLAFYVRSDKNYTLKGIPDGDYEIYFSQGEEWDGGLQQFTSRSSYQRFEDSINFATTGDLYTVWTVTLHPVPEGSAKTSPVDPEEFPDLSSQP